MSLQAPQFFADGDALIAQRQGMTTASPAWCEAVAALFDRIGELPPAWRRDGVAMITKLWRMA